MRPPRLRAVFNFSGSEIIFLLLLALIILGPEKLPEAVRKFAKTYGEFKKVTTGFQTELKQVLDEPMREMRETADAFKKAATLDIDTSVFSDPFGKAVSSADQRGSSTEDQAADPASPTVGPAPVPSATEATAVAPAGNEPPLASPAVTAADAPASDTPASDTPARDTPARDTPASDIGAGAPPPTSSPPADDTADGAAPA